MIIMKRIFFSLSVERTPYQGRYFCIGAWAAPGLESCEWSGARCGSTYASNGWEVNRHFFLTKFRVALGAWSTLFRFVVKNTAECSKYGVFGRGGGDRTRRHNP